MQLKSTLICLQFAFPVWQASFRGNMQPPSLLLSPEFTALTHSTAYVLQGMDCQDKAPLTGRTAACAPSLRPYRAPSVDGSFWDIISASASCRFSRPKQICSNQQLPGSRGAQLHVPGSLIDFVSSESNSSQQQQNSTPSQGKTSHTSRTPFRFP